MCFGKLLSVASIVFGSVPKKVNKNMESYVMSGVRFIVIWLSWSFFSKTNSYVTVSFQTWTTLGYRMLVSLPKNSKFVESYPFP